MERFFSWVASSGFCCWNFQKAVNNTFYNLLFYNLPCVSEPSQSPFLFMIRSLFSISLLIALFFSSFSMAKKKRSPYWAPPRFVATTSPGHSTLSASDSLALQRVLQSENQRLASVADTVNCQKGKLNLFASSSETVEASLLGNIVDIPLTLWSQNFNG